MIAVEAVFWCAVLLVVYTYLGYPGAVALVAYLRPRPVRRGPIRPTVSLVIVAHNEARWIERKLEDCLALEYPRDRLEILVASDGSTDATAEIARRYEAHGVTVLAFETRRGKPSVLNDVVAKCRGQIVLFGDARQTYGPNALVALVENFADPAVGAVSGELVLDGEATALGAGVGFYWRYETFIRRNESHLDSTIGATGAIYAIRRDLFETIPSDTLLDDVLIPLRIVRRGYRVVLEPAARAFDRPAATAGEEFTRKVRTIAGTLQLFARERWLWSVPQNRLWLQAMSHKFLRIVAPYLLGAALAASVLLGASRPVYRLALVAQLPFYAAALTGFFVGRASSVGRWLGIPYAFCVLNVAALVGVSRFFAGTQAVTWDKASDLALARMGVVAEQRGRE